MSGIATAVVVSVITAFVTVQLTLRSFYRQKWWEKQAEVYSRVLESLSHWKLFTEEIMNEFETREGISEERKTLLFKRRSESKDRIDQVTHIGAFIVSGAVGEQLHALRKELRAADKNDGDWYGTMEREWDALTKCIESVRKCARRELKRDSWWRQLFSN